ncbi:pirin family protein [Mucilaginibacter agri]|uniref:Quercetin 2,3-dioxygenase C-terminal cupin domain-containing protein n=1 Tax=Mucilaginibacter agri TaxID=2695265 RepID=A0A965ZCD1_9SPHI|nr:hypothetical protein [Mucilaginibacter agri]NCD68419.1 hypothetical protein [Mucilaginibacter agri]
MAVLTPGRIYLADQRGIKENAAIKQFSTFNYGTYQDDSRTPFGRLKLVNDSVLAAGRSVFIGGNTASYIILVPITGELIFKNAYDHPITLNVGNIYVSYLPEGGFFELTNPYDTDWINFLHLQIVSTEEVLGSVSALYSFDFAIHSDELIPVIHSDSGLPFLIQIGQFSGRSEALYHLKDAKSKIFAFVIAGAFEMEGRLLHQRDSLALWDTTSTDIEALSNNAVILTVEI